MLIELFKEAHGRFSICCCLLENTIFIPLHCKGNIDTMFPDDNDVENTEWLKEKGFVCERTVDCRYRSEDRFDTVIFHYRKHFEELSPEDLLFIQEYHSPEHEFFKYDVLTKYGIVKSLNK
jgi:hypothetical protein